MPKRPTQWNPKGDELAAILDEMRPIVWTFARRDAARLASAARRTIVR